MSEKALELIKEHPWTAGSLAFLALSKLSKRYKRIVWNNTVLELDLSEFTEVVEFDLPTPLVASLTPEVLYFQHLLFTVYMAADDSAISGLFVRLPGLSAANIGVARVDELNQAIAYFRSKGKLAVAFAQHFALKESLNASYLLATAFSKVYLAPMAFVSCVGPIVGVPFVRGLLDMVGIQPEFFQREECKGAGTMLTDKEWTAALKENYQALLGCFTDTLVELLAKNRGVDVDQARKWIKEGPYTAHEAVEIGLVDGTAELDEMFSTILPDLFAIDKKANKTVVNEEKSESNDQAAKAFDEKAEKAFTKRLISLKVYETRRRDATHCAALRHLPASMVMDEDANETPDGFFAGICSSIKKSLGIGRKIVALVTAEGGITEGRQPKGLFGDQPGIYGDTISDALREARLDPRVGVIVFRVNSGGGSAVASAQISRELELAKRANKTVIVSQGNVAASGGYWVSARADSIVANRMTITGSIGVVFGKFVIKELLGDKLKVNYSALKPDDMDNADFWSNTAAFSDKSSERVNVLMDDIYDAFLQHVCAGRGFELEECRQLAKGKIYGGDDALEKRLIDTTGGLITALGLAGKALKLAKTETLVVQRYPKPQSFLKQIMANPTNSRSVVAPGMSLFGTPTAVVRTVAHFARTVRTVNTAVAHVKSTPAYSQFETAAGVHNTSGASLTTPLPTL